MEPQLIGFVDAGNNQYGASARIVATVPQEAAQVTDERKFPHLQQYKCENENVSSCDAAVAWCFQRGVKRVTVTHRYTAGEFPHSRHARLMRFDNEPDDKAQFRA
jgi:hypothetical protein